MDDSRFADLATALQAQYATSPQLVNDDPAFLPDRETILAVLERLRRLLFPGCFPRREPGRIPSLPTRARIEADLDWIHTQLGRQIGLALCHRERAGLSDEAREARCDDCEAQSDTGLALAAQFLLENQDKLENKVYTVPEAIDQEIARIKLESMGIDIDVLTPEQDKYLNSWEEGTV